MQLLKEKSVGKLISAVRYGQQLISANVIITPSSIGTICVLQPASRRVTGISVFLKFYYGLTVMHCVFRPPLVLTDRLCGLVVRIPCYGSRGPGSIPGATRFSEKRVPLSLVSTIEELLERKIAAPV
jgi:hypothetical protein